MAPAPSRERTGTGEKSGKLSALARIIEGKKELEGGKRKQQGAG